jgi:hypothetical protein
MMPSLHKPPTMSRNPTRKPEAWRAREGGDDGIIKVVVEFAQP